ncbi:hypothetical protein SLEP1_g60343, partial [Rubroshorea leprosula]
HRKREHMPAPACLSGWGAQRLKHQNLGSSKAFDQNKRRAGKGSRNKREGRGKGGREKVGLLFQDENRGFPSTMNLMLLSPPSIMAGIHDVVNTTFPNSAVKELANLVLEQRVSVGEALSLSFLSNLEGLGDPSKLPSNSLSSEGRSRSNWIIALEASMRERVKEDCVFLCGRKRRGRGRGTLTVPVTVIV